MSDLNDSRKRILVADKLHPSGLALFDPAFFNVNVDPSLKGEKLQHRLREFMPHVLVVRSTKVTADHLNASSAISMVIRAGAGTNTIDVSEASAKGIFVCNCPGKNAIAVAELTFGHLLNLDRQIADNVSDLRKGLWNKKKFGKNARGLYGLTIAVIGAAGQVGRMVCRRALAFGMHVNGFDPFLTPTMAKEMGIDRFATVEEACTDADVCTVHVPLLKSTKHLINRQIMSKLKDGAYVINTSRGGLIDEEDMLEMIDAKGLKFALDVYENEPSSAAKEFNDERISGSANIYGSHHIGASTVQASVAVSKEMARIALAFCTEGAVSNCVNLEHKTIATHALTVRHADVVGVLASILRVLRLETISIQNMANIVFRGSKSACATLTLDKCPSDECLEEIVGVGGVYSASLSTLRPKSSKL